MLHTPENQKYNIVHTTKDAAALAKDLMRCKLLPWDTETDMTRNALDWKREKQITWQFHDGREAWLIDCRRVDVQVFKPLMESRDVKKLIHNSAFDAAWTLREHGIAVQNIGDTKLQEQLRLGIVLPRKPPTGMKMEEFNKWKPKLSSQLANTLPRYGLPGKFEFIPHYWHQPIKNDKGKVIGFDESKLEQWTNGHVIYDVRDVEHLVELYELQREALYRMDNEYLRLTENKLAEVTYLMMNRGFHIDSQGYLMYALENERYYNARLVELEAINNATGENVSWTAPRQVAKFFGKSKIDDVRRMTRKELDKLPVVIQNAHEIWTELNNQQKNVNTYGLPYLQKFLEHGSRFRCTLNQMVDTGRYSAEDPNLQQVPVTLKRGLKVIPLEFRKFFIPSPGKGMVVADFKAQELAIIAIGSGEPLWLKILRAGGDLHSEVGKLVIHDWMDLEEAERKSKRRLIKDINFGTSYGLGAPGLAKKAEITEAEAEDILRIWWGHHRYIERWLKSNGQFTERTGSSYSFPPYNRYRSTDLDPEPWRKRNVGKNNPVQATGADMMKRSILTAHGNGAYLIHCQHDELVAEYDLDEGPERTIKILSDAMTSAAIQVLGEALTKPDIKVVKTWLDAKD